MTADVIDIFSRIKKKQAQAATQEADLDATRQEIIALAEEALALLDEEE